MNITRALEDNKKIIMTKNEAWASFLYTFLSLTLNSTSSSLGGDGCLGTLNPKLLKIGWKFLKRTCPILRNKK
jgi:hypothetical protein